MLLNLDFSEFFLLLKNDIKIRTYKVISLSEENVRKYEVRIL